MGSGTFEITGLARLQKRLANSQKRLPTLIHAATVEAIAFVYTEALRILDEEIYDKGRPEFAPPLDKDAAGSLWSSFMQEIQTIGKSASKGRLENVSPHAIFLEYGTDDEGSGEHFVPVANGAALHWINPETGADAFDGKGHMVHGIHPIRFMSRALSEHRAQVVGIYRRHLEDIFDANASFGGRQRWTISLPT